MAALIMECCIPTQVAERNAHGLCQFVCLTSKQVTPCLCVIIAKFLCVLSAKRHDSCPYCTVVFRNAFAPVNNNAGVHYFNMITVFAEILRQIKFICNKIQF